MTERIKDAELDATLTRLQAIYAYATELYRIRGLAPSKDRTIRKLNSIGKRILRAGNKVSDDDVFTYVSMFNYQFPAQAK